MDQFDSVIDNEVVTKCKSGGLLKSIFRWHFINPDFIFTYYK